MRILSVAALLAGASLSLSAQAGAYRDTGPKDFTITVPIELKALPPNITEMVISCSVMPADVSNTQNEIGHGSKTFLIRPGTTSYKTSVEVAFNALPGVDASLARFYSCKAQFSGRDHNATVTYFANGGTSGAVFPLDPKAAFYLGSAKWTPIPGAGAK